MASALRRTKVFVSYSHKDDEWIAPLRDHLAGLGDGAVFIDADQIDPGELWDQEIEQGLHTARVAVLLISASFLASRYVKDKELPYLLTAATRQEVTLLPIFLLPCNVPPALAAYQGVNTPQQTLADLQEDPAAQARIWMKASQKIQEVLFELVLVTVAREDREAAERVVAPLEGMGLHFDLEEFENPDDRTLHERVKTRLAQRQATLLMFGARGLGLWGGATLQEALRTEWEALLRESPPSRRLITALLPSAPPDLALPAFLPDNTCIRFPRGLDDLTTIDRLWMGLTGKWKAPSPPASAGAGTAVLPPATSPPAAPAVAPMAAAVAAGMAPQETVSAVPAAMGSASTDPADLEVERLVERVGFENLTLFFGNEVGEASEPVDPTADLPPPRLHELARALTLDLGLNEADAERLCLPLDVAGTYFAVRNGERRLESKVCDLVNQRTRLTETHLQVARLLRTLGDLEKAERFVRRCQRPVRLIVTTAVDLLLERALLLAGVPFVRLVQEPDGEILVINEIRKVELQGQDRLVLQTDPEERRVRCDDVEGLCQAIAELGYEEIVYRERGRLSAAPTSNPLNPLRALPLERYTPQVFLYKFHGSEDVKNSCAISLDQHLRLFKAVLEKNVIPLKITEFLASGPLLIFGCGLLDPPFRMLLNTLPFLSGGEFDTSREFRCQLVQLPPQADDPDFFRRLEAQFWPRIKKQADLLGVAVREACAEKFLADLTAKIEARWR